MSIDAHADSATRAVRFAGGTWDIEDELIIKAVQGAGAYIAQLWLETGSITPEFLRMNGLIFRVSHRNRTYVTEGWKAASTGAIDSDW